ncbi:hypothetical protein Scep_006830 [Stephania cephalantha]|uniref:Uncharacterized protein n=1 Tax=Stephania cephalantha TaxID=152367 RepID=A0AAP0PKG8_9MAGN
MSNSEAPTSLPKPSSQKIRSKLAWIRLPFIFSPQISQENKNMDRRMKERDEKERNGGKDREPWKEKREKWREEGGKQKEGRGRDLKGHRRRSWLPEQVSASPEAQQIVDLGRSLQAGGVS